MNARAWLVRLYPRAWRERYGEEFEALLEQCLHSPLDAVDVALGALDAHLGSIYGTNWRIMNRINKLRTSILIVFAAYIAFIIAGLSLVGLVDDSPAAALMKAGTNAGLTAAWNILAAASAVALLAVVAGGMPLTIRLLRQAFTSSRRTLRLLLVPLLAFIAVVVYVLLMLSVNLGWIRLPGVAQTVSPGNFPLGNKLLLGGLMLVFVVGAIASVVAIWKAVSGLDDAADIPAGSRPLTPGSYQFAFRLAGVATLAMLVMLAATLVFGGLANAASPGWFASNLGLLLTNTAASYAVTVTLMALATAAAVLGMVRGFSARKV